MNGAFQIRTSSNELGQVVFCARDILEAVGYHHMGVTRYCDNIPARYVGGNQFGTLNSPYVAVTLTGAFLMMDNLSPQPHQLRTIEEIKMFLMYYAMPRVGMTPLVRAEALQYMTDANLDAEIEKI